MQHFGAKRLAWAVGLVESAKASDWRRFLEDGGRLCPRFQVGSYVPHIRV